MTKPIPIRLRAGIVGEACRVVHTAVELPAGGFRTLCQTTFAATLIEVVEGGGMPCLQCMARLALRSPEAPPLGADDP